MFKVNNRGTRPTPGVNVSIVNFKYVIAGYDRFASKVYSESCQTSKMELFLKIVYCFPKIISHCRM